MLPIVMCYQFPWLAIRNASKINELPNDISEDPSRSSCCGHNNVLLASVEAGNDRRFWDVKKKDPENSDSSIRSTKLRDRAMINALIAVPSATFLKVDKIKSKGSRGKSTTVIAFPASCKSWNRMNT